MEMFYPVIIAVFLILIFVILLMILSAFNKISPSSPKFLHRPLFSDRDYDFFDRGIDWTEQQEILLKQRVEALKQIYEINKTDSVINFAEHVENPRKVGNAFAQITNNKNDNELLPSFLNSQ